MARTKSPTAKAAATRKRRAKLAEKPVEYLRAQAAKLDISGRSGMNKAALVKAIDEAKAGKTKRKAASKKPKGTKLSALAKGTLPSAITHAGETYPAGTKLSAMPLAALRTVGNQLNVQAVSAKKLAAKIRASAKKRLAAMKAAKPKAAATRALRTQKARKAAAASQKAAGAVRHGKGAYRLVVMKDNAMYGNLGPYASARAALTDAKTLLRRMAPAEDYALSNVEAQAFVGAAIEGGKVVDGYVVTSRGGPDLSAGAFAVQMPARSKAAYAADEIPAPLRANTRRRSRRNTTPSEAQVRKVVNLLKINREEGIYRLPVVQIMVDTGLDVDTVTAILTKRLGYDLEPPTGSRAGRGRFGHLFFGHGHRNNGRGRKGRKNPRVSFTTKDGKRVSFMAKKR